MSIVLMNKNKCIAVGSVLMVQLDDELPGQIGELMYDPSYGSGKEILHRLVYCLESLAWALKCTYISLFGPLSQQSFVNTVLDLDYEDYRKDGMMFMKLNSGDSNGDYMDDETD